MSAREQKQGKSAGLCQRLRCWLRCDCGGVVVALVKRRIVCVVNRQVSKQCSASRYRSCRADWNTGSPSQSKPSQCRSSIISSAAPGTTRGSSMSSMRSSMPSRGCARTAMLRASHRCCRCACGLMGWVRNDLARGPFLSLAGGSVLPMRRPVAPMLATVPASAVGTAGFVGRDCGMRCWTCRDVPCRGCSVLRKRAVAVRYLTV